MPMCLLTFAYQTNKRFPFVFAANRDEYYDRPTLFAHEWKEDPNVIGGRDLKKGGTWLGFTKEGKIAALTNVRDSFKHSGIPFQSRGFIARDYLTSNTSAQLFMERLIQTANEFDGYNLVFGSYHDLYYYTNRMEKGEKLKPGYYMLSNGQMNSNWPKAVKVRTHLQSVLEREKDVETIMKKLLVTMQDEERFPDEQLPDTGVGIEWERILSPIFINGKSYGTRATTVIVCTDQGESFFREWNYGPKGTFLEKREFHLQLPSSYLNMKKDYE